MLQNAYLLAKIGADTAENERTFVENLPKFGNYPTRPEEEIEETRSRSSAAELWAEVDGAVGTYVVFFARTLGEDGVLS